MQLPQSKLTLQATYPILSLKASLQIRVMSYYSLFLYFNKLRDCGVLIQNQNWEV